MQTGNCSCNDAVVGALGEFFVESVKTIGDMMHDILCPLLKALDVVIMITEAAIPGPGQAITGGMKFAIASAKAYRYAYKAEEAASEWADFFSVSFSTSEAAGCGKPPGLDDLLKSFLHLVNAPDELIEGIDYASIPCPKGKCKPRNGHGKGDGKGDGKDDGKDKDKPSDAPKTDKPESASRPSKTDDASSRNSPTSNVNSLSSETQKDGPTKTSADTITRTTVFESASQTITGDPKESSTRTSSGDHPFSDFVDKLRSFKSRLPTRTKGSTNTATSNADSKTNKCGGPCRFRDEL
ncbi:hypothetical protein K491DRAFT_445638 [Lophiostoma macrostomum CBS 122681]|uniref:Uncharacterized protein n=1 Tax=Lophiostoma macrostomum CBS 122681 TaxID=1314788 RepID=A0A6A6T572_9PLEO|nr:hypothetical protein K491DRAFT_445638 [Lophiostoma macrostomum CBS 122681]